MPVDLAKLREYFEGWATDMSPEWRKVGSDCLAMADEIEALRKVAEAAQRECHVDGVGYRRDHVSDDLHRALAALARATGGGGE